MVGYRHVRDLLRGNNDLYAHLDAAQLVKHAMALRTAVQSRKGSRGDRPRSGGGKPRRGRPEIGGVP